MFRLRMSRLTRRNRRLHLPGAPSVTLRGAQALGNRTEWEAREKPPCPAQIECRTSCKDAETMVGV